MKYSLALISTVAFLGVISCLAGDGLSPHFEFNRYSAMVDNSPFAIATAVAKPAATPNFAKDLWVANAAHSPKGDVVTIASSSDKNFKKYLTTREPVDGYSITSIEWSDRVGATKVTISKDGQFATLTFNEVLLSQRAAPNPQPIPDQAFQSMPPPPVSMPATTFPDPPKIPRRVVPERQKPGSPPLPSPEPIPVSPSLPDPPKPKSLRSQQQRVEEEAEQQRRRKEDSLRPVTPPPQTDETNT